MNRGKAVRFVEGKKERGVKSLTRGEKQNEIEQGKIL